MAGRPRHLFIQRGNGKRTGVSVTGLIKIHQLGMIVHHGRSLRFTGMVVYGGLEITLGGNDAEPVRRQNQEIGIDEGKVANHSFEIIPAVTADDNQLADALGVKGSHNIFQDGLLGGVTGMDAERKFPLSGIVSAERYGRHHHAAHAGTFQRQSGGIHGNVMRQDAVREIRQMQVMRLGGSPGKNHDVILHVFHLSIAGNGKVYFSFFHSCYL